MELTYKEYYYTLVPVPGTVLPTVMGPQNLRGAP